MLPTFTEFQLSFLTMNFIQLLLSKTDCDRHTRDRILLILLLLLLILPLVYYYCCCWCYYYYQYYTCTDRHNKLENA